MKESVCYHTFMEANILKIKKAKNIEMMNLSNKRPMEVMKVALRYFWKVFGPIYFSKRYILNIKER